jgi:tRNA (guanine-N7-)-methyltransferase
MNSIRSFVKRQGQITKGQERALHQHQEYLINSEDPTLIDLDHYFAAKDVILEIGFGMGSATYQIARSNPDKGYLGMEVYSAGVGKLLLAIAEHQLENVYIVQDDAAKVIPTMLGDASLSGIHVFYPDPWPKKRHHKRRLLQKDFIHLLASKLKKDGYLYIVTDWQEYAEEILVALQNDPLLANTYDTYAPALEWRPITRFNEKANSVGRASWELYFYRK